LEEKKELTEHAMHEIKAKLHKFDEAVDILTKNIDVKGSEVDKLTAKVDEARKVNKIEDDKFRKLS
jgi:SMC interacting uncharacterized protein involved in chromosome segregation